MGALSRYCRSFLDIIDGLTSALPLRPVASFTDSHPWRRLLFSPLRGTRPQADDGIPPGVACIPALAKDSRSIMCREENHPWGVHDRKCSSGKDRDGSSATYISEKGCREGTTSLPTPEQGGDRNVVEAVIDTTSPRSK